MLIGYEVTTIKKGRSGVGYYTECLLKALLKYIKKEELILYSNTRESFSELGLDKNIGRDAMRCVSTSEESDLSEKGNILSGVQKYESGFCSVRAFWMQFILPGILKKTKPDFCHFTNYLAPIFTSVPIIVNIYDMTLTMFPEYHYLKKRILSRPVIPIIAKKAKRIITTSENTKKDIIKYFGIDSDKIRVIYCGVSDNFEVISDEKRLETIRKRYNINGKIILYVGNIEPRKNLIRLIEAFHILIKKYNVDKKLLLVGSKAWGYKEVYQKIKELNLGDKVVCTSYVAEEELPLLYNCADIFAYPSLYEGFGLPIIEAFACGVPVLTSLSPSLDEVASDFALRVNETDANAIAEGLLRLVQDKKLCEDFIEKGKKRAKLFNWDETARKTIEVYKEMF